MPSWQCQLMSVPCHVDMRCCLRRRFICPLLQSLQSIQAIDVTYAFTQVAIQTNDTMAPYACSSVFRHVDYCVGECSLQLHQYLFITSSLHSLIGRTSLCITICCRIADHHPQHPSLQLQKCVAKYSADVSEPKEMLHCCLDYVYLLRTSASR